MVDVIIPSYNRKDLLNRAIQSVQNQTFKDWQLWVVDDGSTDNTSTEFTRIFSSHPQMHIISLRTIGELAMHEIKELNRAMRNGWLFWIQMMNGYQKS